MRALATDREIAALQGDADVQNPEDYRRKARYRIRNRIDRLEHELDSLNDVAPELVAALRLRVCTHDGEDDELNDQLHAARREIRRLAQMIAEEDADIDIDQLHRELRAGIDDADDASGDGGDK